jgi:hypothetical protein
VLGATDYLGYSAPAPRGPFTPSVASVDAFDTAFNLSAPNATAISLAWRAENTSTGVRSDFASVVTVTPTSAAPLQPGLTLTRGNEAMQVAWPAVSGATSYRVYRRAPGVDWRQVATITSPRWTDRDVFNGEQFAYAVQAVGPSQVSGWAVAGLSLVDPALPPVVEGVTVIPGNASQGGPYSLWTVASGTFESRALVTGALNGIPLWAVVWATNASGAGVASQPVSVLARATLPTTPAASAFAQATPGAVRVSWGPVTGATGHRVYRRLVSGPPVKVAEPTASPYDDSGLTTGATYLYYVQAVNSDGPGAWSLPVTVVAP